MFKSNIFLRHIEIDLIDLAIISVKTGGGAYHGGEWYVGYGGVFQHVGYGGVLQHVGYGGVLQQTCRVWRCIATCRVWRCTATSHAVILGKHTISHIYIYVVYAYACS